MLGVMGYRFELVDGFSELNYYLLDKIKCSDERIPMLFLLLFAVYISSHLIAFGRDFFWSCRRSLPSNHWCDVRQRPNGCGFDE